MLTTATLTTDSPQAVAFAEASSAPIIPVRLWFDEARSKWRKEPLAAWSRATTAPETIEEWWQRWPDALPAIPLARMGWAVVDADVRDGVDGIAALPSGCLGPHSRIRTPSGGLHLVFAQPPHPIGRLRWCEGVEVLGTSCLLTCYDLEELLFPRAAPRAILPEVFWQARGLGGQFRSDGSRISGGRENRALEGNLRIKSRAAGRAKADGVEVASLTAALWEMDPTDWRGDYEGWFALAGACRFVGIACAEFVRWSTTDPFYAADARLIERIWESASPVHGGAFFKAAKERGIIVKPAGLYPEVPSKYPTPSPTPTKTINLPRRVERLLAWLSRSPTEPTLFNISCVFAEIATVEKRMAVSMATSLLADACGGNGLRAALGREGVQQTIANAFRRVKEKRQ